MALATTSNTFGGQFQNLHSHCFALFTDHIVKGKQDLIQITSLIWARLGIIGIIVCRQKQFSIFSVFFLLSYSECKDIR